MKTKIRIFNPSYECDEFFNLKKIKANIIFHLNDEEFSKIDWSNLPEYQFEIDLPEKKNVLSSISDNDLLNELIDRLILNTKYSDREKLFETWKKRLFGGTQ